MSINQAITGLSIAIAIVTITTWIAIMSNSKKIKDLEHKAAGIVIIE